MFDAAVSPDGTLVWTSPQQMFAKDLYDNDDPYGDGWVCVIAVADEGELAQLLDAEGYRSLIEG